MIDNIEFIFYKKIISFIQNNLKNLIVISSLLIANSCNSKSKDINTFFIEQYGDKVAEITKYRTQPKELKDRVFYFKSPTKEDVEKSFKRSRYNKYRYVDVNQFNDVEEDYLDEQLRLGALSPRIFDIVYFTKNHGPFITEADHFANIKIPEYDAYGIPTQFSSKPYLLVSDKSLKDGVDYISYQNHNLKHLKQSKLLIKERTSLRKKQRMEKLLGKDIN